MDRLPEKLRNARRLAGISQSELAEAAKISRRSVFAYERGTSVPRRRVVQAMAAALGVTEAYLTDDATDDPEEGRLREERIHEARSRFGARGAREAAELLDRNSAFFAGGDIPQEDKDAFFDAVMVAYVTAKEEARARFSARRDAPEEE